MMEGAVSSPPSSAGCNSHLAIVTTEVEVLTSQPATLPEHLSQDEVLEAEDMLRVLSWIFSPDDSEPS